MSALNKTKITIEPRVRAPKTAYTALQLYHGARRAACRGFADSDLSLALARERGFLSLSDSLSLRVSLSHSG